MDVPSSVRRKRAQTIFSFLLVYHLCAIIVANLPDDTAFGGELQAPFKQYTELAGLTQRWDMFTTKPYYLDLTGDLEAIDENGEASRYGLILPGLVPYVDSLRVDAVFFRLGFSAKNFRKYFRRYHASACRAIAARTGAMPRSVQLKLVPQRIQPLEMIQKTRQIARPRPLMVQKQRCR